MLRKDSPGDGRPLNNPTGGWPIFCIPPFPRRVPHPCVFLQEPALSLPKGWAAMLPAQLLSVLHYPLWMPSSYQPFAKYAKDGAPVAAVASAV